MQAPELNAPVTDAAVRVESIREEPEVTQPPVVATPIPHVPKLIASFSPPPATYQLISQHDDGEVPPPRPVRRRRSAESGVAAPEPLQLVETQPSPLQTQPVFVDELPRRTKPRRRREVAIDNAPLQLVETQAGGSTDGSSSSA
jgi:hypothetical protein